MQSKRRIVQEILQSKSPGEKGCATFDVKVIIFAPDGISDQGSGSANYLQGRLSDYTFQSMIPIRICIDFDPLDPDPFWEYGSPSGSRRPKIVTKKKNNYKISVFKEQCPSRLRGEGFNSSLKVLYVGQNSQNLNF